MMIEHVYAIKDYARQFVKNLTDDDVKSLSEVFIMFKSRLLDMPSFNPLWETGLNYLSSKDQDALFELAVIEVRDLLTAQR